MEFHQLSQISTTSRQYVTIWGGGQREITHFHRHLKGQFNKKKFWRCDHVVFFLIKTPFYKKESLEP